MKTKTKSKTKTTDTIQSLTKTLIDLIATGIGSVLAGEREQFEIKPFQPHTAAVSAEMVCNILEPMGWEKGELETNGWQYDWWLPFTKGSQSFTASGSGYYGGFLFAKTEV